MGSTRGRVRGRRLLAAVAAVLVVLPPGGVVLAAEPAAAAWPFGGSEADPAGGALAGADPVSAAGTYQSSIAVPVPPGPGAPTVSLGYDSASAGGVAGVGWDLSVGVPMAISRDTRFGTPLWRFDGRWQWGGATLVPDDPNGCTGQAACHFRTDPESLAAVTLDARAGSAGATVDLPAGVRLTYAAVRYDGAAYPAAPPGSESDVLAFALAAATDANGYRTCYLHQHHGDTARGRVASLVEVTWGRKVADCAALPPAAERHRVTFGYADAAAKGYFAPWSMRMGAPVSFRDLLNTVTVRAMGAEQYELSLLYEGPGATETRRPLLRRVDETAIPGGDRSVAQTRVLRSFRYGSRSAQYGEPRLLDLGRAEDFPSSLTGSVSRPMRNQQFFGNPNGLFQAGNDQHDGAAPASHATTEQWALQDMDGDGLPDWQWGRETGFLGTPWPTYETSAPVFVPPPAQQIAIVNEGVTGSTLHTSRHPVDTHPAAGQAGSLAGRYPPEPGGTGSASAWLWADGRGQTRSGLPTSVSSPEIARTSGCPPTAPGDDTRRWPVFPDGTLGGSQASTAEQVSNASTFWLGGRDYNITTVLTVLNALRAPVVPRQTVSAALSGWKDMTGDGVPDYVVTPSMINRFDRPGACLAFPRNPSPAGVNGAPDTDWHVAAARPDGGAPGGLGGTTRRSGPPGPAGLPLDYTVSWGNSEGFGFTIPVGSAIWATAAAVASRGQSLMNDAPGLVAEAFAPRSAGGTQLTPPAPSLTGTLLGAAAVRDRLGAARFVASTFGPTLDVVLVSATSRGRTQSRGQAMDVNADGFLDYLLYDSGAAAGGGDPGDLVVYLGDGSGGFRAPKAANKGFDYATRPDLVRLAQLAGDADGHATASATLTPACRDTPDDTPQSAALKAAACLALAIPLGNQSATMGAARTAIGDFLADSPDALPTDRARVNELVATRDGILAVGGLAALLGGADGPNEASQFASDLAHLSERTVRQLDYRSRINMISKGFSELDGATVGSAANGLSAQTAGLVDLNGDGLPDYVITKDREDPCPAGRWQVYWGTGEAALGSGRLFSPAVSCVAVPEPPPEVAARGYATLPLSVDMVRRAPAPAVPGTIDAVSQSYVSLHDHNQDGRPDLVVAGGAGQPWSASDTSRTWTVYLNGGAGFDLANPLTVQSPTAALADVEPASPYAGSALDVPYPSLSSTHTDAGLTSARDRSDQHAGAFDADGDGVSDMVRLVRHSPATVNGAKTWRAGLLVWSRAGAGPQDVLIEERHPVDGSRLLVEYRPSAAFQWRDGRPDGAPPEDGHRSAAGEAGQLVRSVTVERLMGRDELRTRTGHDYRRPGFDVPTRTPTGFGWRSTEPLDPATGAPFGDGAATIRSGDQRVASAGAAGHERQVVRASGAPVAETLTSRVEYRTSKGGGPRGAVLSAPVRTLRVEYPEGLTAGPALDVGFDGDEPLLDRAGHRAPTATGGGVFDPAAPTGGAMLFPGTAAGHVRYPSPHPAAPATFDGATVEAWVSPAAGGGARTLVDQPGAYRLGLAPGGEVRFTVRAPGGDKIVTGPALAAGRWWHVAAAFGGGAAKLFVNGAEVASAAATGALSATGELSVGCAPAAGQPVECFAGQLGEVRVYRVPWPGPARVTDDQAEVRGPGQPADPLPHDLGQPVRLVHRNDLARADDDVVEEITYAAPTGGAPPIAGAVSSLVQRALRPDSATSGDYLTAAETSYDNLPAGQVGAGNVTAVAAYDGTPVAARPIKLASVTRTAYGDANCPGRVTRVVDPLGNPSATAWDATCAFPVGATNALGHGATGWYYGVAGVPLLTGGGGGWYGQPYQQTDANGQTTTTVYDPWGRPLRVTRPLDRPGRPGEVHAYAPVSCRASAAKPEPLGCEEAAARELATPARHTVRAWDDQVDDYLVRYEFGDGQVHAQTAVDGNPVWTVAGVADVDGRGRIVRTYKVRALPDAATATTDPCPPAGTWCDSAAIKGDPLRDPAVVATTQTAYDGRGRVIRTYGPRVPRCAGDPSSVAPGGGPACDAKIPADGDVTRIAYPAPGVVRTVDAKGVPAVSTTDVRGLRLGDAEFLSGGVSPYATVTHAYDALGRRVRTVDDGGNATTATYDALGRERSVDDPDMGRVTQEYDLAGHPTEQVAATGDRTVNHYDRLGRVSLTEFFRPEQPTLTAEPLCCATGIEKIKFSTDKWLKLVWVDKWKAFSPVGPCGPVQGGGPCPRPGNWGPLKLTAGDLDDGVAELALPFDLTLTPTAAWSAGKSGLTTLKAGRPVYVSTNGKIRLDQAGAADLAPGTGAPLPTRRPEQGLYPYFADLRLDAGGLRYSVDGEAPERELTVEWSGTTGADRAVVRFRAVLSEKTSAVRYEYLAVPPGRAATVGAQNHDMERTALAVLPEAAAAPFEPRSGLVIGTDRPAGGPVVALRQAPGAAPVATTAEIPLDLRGAATASVSFRHGWLSRCAEGDPQTCTVDRMSVGVRDAEHPGEVRELIGPARLRSAAALDRGTRREVGEQLTARIPADLMGHQLSLVFAYEPGAGEPSAGTPVQWVVGDVNLTRTAAGPALAGAAPEERVERWYDSFEQPVTYAAADPVLDLSFDEPAAVADRSPRHAPLSFGLPAKVAPVPGQSGWGTGLTGGATVTADLDAAGASPPPKNLFHAGVTAQAWVSLPAPGAGGQAVLTGAGAFRLARRADRRLECSVTTAAGTSTAAGATAVPDATWAHVALVHDGQRLRCYLNGAEDAAAAAPGATGDTKAVVLGDPGDTGTVPVRIDEARVFATARPPAQVLADALHPLEPGPARGNVLDLRFGDPAGRGADSSTAANPATLAGADVVPGVQGAAIALDGGGTVSVPHASSLTIPEAVTAEAWIRTPPTAAMPAGILEKSAGGAGWRLRRDAAGRLRWEVRTKIRQPDGSVTLSGPYVFVTYEQVDDDRWHHVAATYEGTRLRVYLDGLPAHRTCSPLEESPGEVPCADPPKPDECTTEVGEFGDNPPKKYPDAVCARGTIDNGEPIVGGAGLTGELDELRVSTYAKRKWEVAASARTAAEYTRVLGGQVRMRNELPAGSPVAEEHRAFDVLGRPVSAWTAIAGQRSATPFQGRTSYDNQGRVSALEYPTGEVTQGSYDASGVQTALVGYQPFEAAGAPGRQVYLDRAAATLTGQLSTARYGNGVSTRYTYDDARRPAGGFGSEQLTGQSVTHPTGGALSGRGYTWDAVGNLATATDTAFGGLSATFTHDDLRRVTAAAYTAGAGSPATAGYAFGYDARGNLTTKQGAVQQYGRSLSPAGCGAGGTTLPHAVTRRTLAGATTGYCYDQAGRLTDTAEAVPRHLGYRARGTLALVERGGAGHTFGYDGDGVRVTKTEPAGRTTEPSPLFRETPGGGIESVYTANGAPVARRTGPTAGAVRWFHADHLGGTTFMTDAAGGVAPGSRTEYLPYGEPLPQVPGPDPALDQSGGRQYTGKELDDTGYYDYAARTYDPVTGRFLQPDSVVPGPGPQAFNRYTYTLGDPLSYVDPSGHQPAPFGPFNDPSMRMGPNEIQRLETMRAAFELKDARAALEAHLSAGNTGEESERTLADLQTRVDYLAATTMSGLVAHAGEGLLGLFRPGPVSPKPAPKPADLDAPAAGAQRTTRRQLSTINPTGGTENCVNCAVALDLTLGGAPSCAMPGKPVFASQLQRMYGKGFYGTTASHLANELRAAGDGARGIVYLPPPARASFDPRAPAHVINAVNDRGFVKFLDGQLQAQVPPPAGPIYFMRTNQGLVPR